MLPVPSPQSPSDSSAPASVRYAPSIIASKIESPSSPAPPSFSTRNSNVGPSRLPYTVKSLCRKSSTSVGSTIIERVCKRASRRIRQALSALSRAERPCRRHRSFSSGIREIRSKYHWRTSALILAFSVSDAPSTTHSLCGSVHICQLSFRKMPAGITASLYGLPRSGRQSSFSR